MNISNQSAYVGDFHIFAVNKLVKTILRCESYKRQSNNNISTSWSSVAVINSFRKRICEDRIGTGSHNDSVF